MKSLTNKTKQVVLYPGRDLNYNYCAIPLHNTVITGSTGYGKTQLANQLVTKLVEENSPTDVSINIWSNLGDLSSAWTIKRVEGKPQRIIPHVGLSVSSKDMTMNDFIGIAVEVVKNKRQDDNCKDIFIIDSPEYPIGSYDLKDLYDCEEKNVFLFVICQNSELKDEVALDLFINRFCAATDSDTSRRYIGCDIASNLTRPGECYYWYRNSLEVPKLLYIPMKPSVLHKKFLTAYAQTILNINESAYDEKQALNAASVLECMLDNGKTLYCGDTEFYDSLMHILKKTGLQVVGEVSGTPVSVSKSDGVIYVNNCDNMVEGMVDVTRITFRQAR